MYKTINFVNCNFDRKFVKYFKITNVKMITCYYFKV